MRVRGLNCPITTQRRIRQFSRGNCRIVTKPCGDFPAHWRPADGISLQGVAMLECDFNAIFKLWLKQPQPQPQRHAGLSWYAF